MLEGHIEDAQASFGAFAVVLIMLGIVRGKQQEIITKQTGTTNIWNAYSIYKSNDVYN